MHILIAGTAHPRRWVFALLFITAITPSFGSRAHAAEEGMVSIEKTGWRLTPSVSYMQYYSNNISLDPSGEEDSDLLFIGRVGLHIMNPEMLREKPREGGRRVLLDVDAAVDGVLFLERDRKGIRPALNLDFGYFSGTGFLAKVHDGMLVTEEPANDELTDLQTRIDNNGSITLGYELGHLGVSAGYENRIRYYFDDETLNWMEQTLRPELSYRPSPKTRFGVNYGFGMIDYEESTDAHSDATYHELQGTIEWKATPKFRLALAGGWQWRDYTVASSGDFSSWTAAIQLDWVFRTAMSWLTLRLERRPIESSYEDENFYVSNGGTLSVSQRFAERWLAKAHGGVHVDTYPNAAAGTDKKREDTIWVAGIDLDVYILKGLSLGAGYAHRVRQSNIDGEDYEEDRVKLLQVNAVF